MGLFEELHQQGNTIILVTHEEDIAEHAHRIIRLRDGKIESDETGGKAGKIRRPRPRPDRKDARCIS